MGSLRSGRHLATVNALAQWYRQRTAAAPSTRKTLIVALARKLLIALWRLARDMKTAKALGIEVPTSILLRADEVIQ